MTNIKRENTQTIPKLLRYPGGKSRLLGMLQQYLPMAHQLSGNFIDPFVGGASVFFFLQPREAMLSDLNEELIDLYINIRDYPEAVWDYFTQMPNDKEGYYKIRALKTVQLSPSFRAARLLYLNRTCFKGMWRHNKHGQFNIGYGGQSRRWVVQKEELLEVAGLLRSATIRSCDFEAVIRGAKCSDFIFVDPPYRPGHRDLSNSHYTAQEFTYDDQRRLADTLRQATRRGIAWVMTNSSHPDITKLYRGESITIMPIGTGERPGILSSDGREAVITNRY